MNYLSSPKREVGRSCQTGYGPDLNSFATDTSFRDQHGVESVDYRHELREEIAIKYVARHVYVNPSRD